MTVPCSATGHATTTKPIQGFQDPKLADIFASLVTPSTTKPDGTTPATPSDYSPSEPPVGPIAGGTVGGFVLVLLITGFLILRRRRQRTAPPQPIPELVPTPFKPEELQACEIHELPRGSREYT